jgi:hypothetical protein
MSLWKNHSRSLLLVLLIPIAFGCRPPAFKMSDSQLTEHLTKNTTDRTGKIVLSNGKIFDGFSLAVRGDSLTWSEEPNEEGKHYAAEVHDVESVTIHAAHEGWPIYFGLGGCAVGGCAGLSYSCFRYASESTAENGTIKNTATFNWTVPVVAAVVGAGLGYGGGYWFDPGFQQNAWVLKAVTPRPEKSSTQTPEINLNH